MTIHSAIIAAMADISATGIAKLDRNKDQGYSFRGIEAAMNSLSPILVRRGISVASSYDGMTISERATKSGGTMRFVVVRGTFRFSAADGSYVDTSVYGEAADTSDKAATKAQSVAFRTALFQLFVVPTMAVDPESHDEPAPDPREERLQDDASRMVQLFEAGKEVAAYEVWTALTDSEDQLYVWRCLGPHSALRATLKRLKKADSEPTK